MFCHFWQKFENGRHFWGGEIFLKIAKITFFRYPVGRKFRRNRSISHSYGDRSNFVFCHFWQKFENSKWLSFLGREKFFFKLPRVQCSDTLWIENFDEIAPSHTVKEIEANLCFAKKFENSKWPPFLRRGKYFENCKEYIP